MKTPIVKLIPTLIIVLLLGITYSVSAQPPDPNSNANVQSNKVNGGGAPIDGGLIILLSLGAAYGSKKLYDLKKLSGE